MHQDRANELTSELAELNEKLLLLNRRKRELEQAVSDEFGTSATNADEQLENLQRLYREAGVILPEETLESFEKVTAFHQSVSRNRKLFLRSELTRVDVELREIKAQIKARDDENSEILQLLNSTMALEAFTKAQQDLTDIDTRIAQLTSRIDDFKKLGDMDVHLKLMRAEAENAMHIELSENDTAISEAKRLYVTLANEIYSDRKASLSFDITNRGVLKVVPKIEGDDSSGIMDVSIFLFDMISVILGSAEGRCPRFLVHDSQLFDAMDNRQLASCLNIGARMSEQYDIQYIVTLNTDKLAAAEALGFRTGDYPINQVLTDKGEAGGLFGFRFN